MEYSLDSMRYTLIPAYPLLAILPIIGVILKIVAHKSGAVQSVRNVRIEILRVFHQAQESGIEDINK
jgi:plasmid stabilization system protein ParE